MTVALAAELIPWREVELWCAHRGFSASTVEKAIARGDEAHARSLVRALDEYRLHGMMQDVYPCDLDEVDDDTGDSTGPEPEEIDWTGFDEVLTDGF